MSQPISRLWQTTDRHPPKSSVHPPAPTFTRRIAVAALVAGVWLAGCAFPGDGWGGSGSATRRDNKPKTLLNRELRMNEPQPTNGFTEMSISTDRLHHRPVDLKK